MPPTGYLTATGIESCLQYLSTTYPSICSLIVQPEASIEGRTIRAVKIAEGASSDRHGILFIGGVHAREIVPPDLLVSWALRLCQAYTGGTGLTFGPKTYDASIVKLIVESLDIFVLPLVNPDGRTYVQDPGGDPWWRKNRRPNSGSSCSGVDINRNYDFLWSTAIGSSTSPCSDTFHGAGAFSEPETRNVRHVLDTYTNIDCMADVHSYSELVLHPWGDDDEQTVDPTMNFQNPVYDGMRGTPGDSVYKEYIPSADLSWFTSTGDSIRDAIAAVRGHTYTVEPAVLLYPTSGTSKDHAYSRHFVDATKRRVYAYTIETGTEFQPAYAEGLNVMSEVSAGLTQFCIACLCVVEETVLGTEMEERLVDLRRFRDRDLLTTPAGRRMMELLQRHSADVVTLLRSKPRRERALELLRKVDDIVRTSDDREPKRFDRALIASIDKTIESFVAKGSPDLRRAADEVRTMLAFFRGRTAREGLAAASERKKRTA